MLCPNCGFNSAPGTMFCGNCGTRLTAAPAQPTPAAPPAPAPQANAVYTPPQRPAYTPPAAQSGYYSAPPAEPSPRPVYPSYSSPMMQSPYISGAARASTPVLSSSREGAAQYTAVSTNVYSPHAKAAAVASENATKKRKAGKVISTLLAVFFLAAMGVILYFSGVFTESDNSIYVPEESGDVQTSVTEPDTDDSDAENTPPVISSDSDIEEEPSDEPQDDTPATPGNLSRTNLAEVNAFISALTEVGLTDLSSTVTADELVEFAISSLCINSSVINYDANGFSIGDATYNYTIDEELVKQRIARYFGESIQLYPAIGDSGDGWMYYGNNYYFMQVAGSKGFAIITDYSASGDIVDVKFNIYSPAENEASYYSMTAEEVKAAGCTVIGTGSATLGKTTYNGRDTYVISSIKAIMN